MDDPYIQYMYSYPHKTAYRGLEGIQISDYIPFLSHGNNSLYFHIPFCQYKCGYCNLFSLAGQTQQRMEVYVETMERQAEQLAGILPSDLVFSDLTLGGGTPLILPEPLLQRIFRMAGNVFGFQAENCPVVVETSPNQTTREKLALLKREGVSRISIGVQSFQEEELAALHRLHYARTARRALGLIRDIGFSCLNIDLIYGIPGQTMESLQDSLRQALEFKPEELFVYPLYIKPGTPLYQQGAKRQEDTWQMYWQVLEILEGAGYEPHSMRRFVRRSSGGYHADENADRRDQDRGDQDRGDQDKGDRKAASLPESLCGFGNTLSIGCGGRSYLGPLHFCAPYAVKQGDCLAVLEQYLQQKDFLSVSHGFLLSQEEQRRRYVIRHILFGRGICQKDYRKYFEAEVTEEFPLFLEWERLGYLVRDGGYLTLTRQGFALSDHLGQQLISPEVRARSEGFYREWRLI